MVKEGEWFNQSVSLSGVQGDDEFTTKRRVVLDSHFLEHLPRNTDVAQVNSASAFGQRKGQAERQQPLGLDCMALPAYRGVQAEHRRSVLVGPVRSRPVPRLVHQECVLVAVQTVYD